MNIAAAQAFHAREGDLDVPRGHIEVVDGQPLKLGAFVHNASNRYAKFDAERRAALNALGIRWKGVTDENSPAEDKSAQQAKTS